MQIGEDHGRERHRAKAGALLEQAQRELDSMRLVAGGAREREEIAQWQLQVEGVWRALGAGGNREVKWKG